MSLPPFKFSLIVVSVLVITLLAGGFLFLFTQGNDSHPRLIPDQVMTTYVDPQPLSEFALIDHNNHVFNLLSLRGNWSFLFFGFTHCPDICPSTLVSLSKLREQISKGVNGSKNIQFVFISVDPRRDTAAILKKYTGYFDSSIIGVTGDHVQLNQLSKQLDATYEIENTQSKSNYQVSHTSTVFLINPQGQYQALLVSPFDIDSISRRFEVLTKINTIKHIN